MSDGFRSPASARSLSESLRMTEKAEEQYDVCPECGEEYADTDTTMAYDVVFVHQEDPLETCTLQEDIDA